MAWVYGFEISEELDKRIKHYQIDHNLQRKSEAIIKMLEAIK